MTAPEKQELFCSVEDLNKDPGYTVRRLSSSRFYVYEDLPIQEPVSLFNDKGSEVNALGVVSREKEFAGIFSTRRLLMLCDVSGKGVAASIVTAMLYGITRI